MRKLIVEEYTVTEDDHKPDRMLPVGSKYVYFVDPDTGKRYRPVAGFFVKSETDLSDRFVEIAD